jgi:uncharacterized membrane protein
MKHLFLSLLCASTLLAASCGSDSKCADAKCGGGDGDGDGDGDIDCDAADAPTYENYGREFVANHCLTCHSAEKEGTFRLGAPVGVDFDTVEEIRADSDAVHELTVVKKTMPFGTSSLTDEERQEFGAWLDCGAP